MSDKTICETMKKVIRYQCEFCKKLFMTPDRHYCKMNPELKNCFTCANYKGSYEESSDDGYGKDIVMECEAGWEYRLEELKHFGYELNCSDWKGVIND